MLPNAIISGELQQALTNMHLSPFGDSTSITSDGPRSEHLNQNDSTDSPAANTGDVFPADFDIPREFWPSSEQTLAKPESSAPTGRADRAQGASNNLASQGSRYSLSPEAALWFQRQGERPLDVELRRDIFARNSLRELILSSVLSETLDPTERVAILDDCKGSAEASGLGIPFRQILSEPMDHLDVPPLMYEIMRCHLDWDWTMNEVWGSGLEMVHFLIDNWYENVLAHGRMGRCMDVIRTACLRRDEKNFDNNNRLFQYLRPCVLEQQEKTKQEYVYYDVSVTSLTGGYEGFYDTLHSDRDFTALISITHFGWRSTRPPTARPDEKSTPSSFSKKALPSQGVTYVSVEFLASRRAWRLKVDNNTLTLELLDGPGGSFASDQSVWQAPLIDTRAKVIMPEQAEINPSDASGSFSSSKDYSVELLFPRASLRPSSASGSGSSELKLSPCFCAAHGDYDAIRDLNDARLHDPRGSLLLELTVRFDHEPSDFALINMRNSKAASQLPVVPSAGPPALVNMGTGENDEDDLYVTSEDDAYIRRNGAYVANEESEWEELSQVDETEPKEGGWVKASWSGKDEDL